jgi:hypothetical protein
VSFFDREQRLKGRWYQIWRARCLTWPDLRRRPLAPPLLCFCWLTALAALHIAIVSFVWFTPRIVNSIPSSAIAKELGHAFVAPVQYENSSLYVLPTDRNEAAYESDLALFENGSALGPAHTLHARIRELGDGRFSHWQGSIIFSSSDGSDPRVNGRIYSIESPIFVNLKLRIFLLVVLVLANTIFFLSFRSDVSAFFRFWTLSVLRIFAVGMVVAAALSALGLFGTLIVAKSGMPKDAALTIQALQHACLGCLLSLGFWAAGAGISLGTMRDRRAQLAHVLIPAFPVGLLTLAALTSISLLFPKGREISLALWVVCLLPLLRWRPGWQDVADGIKAALSIIPLAIAFGIWLALLWHGPTESLSGSPSGDLTYYAGGIWSIAHQAYPYIDLGYANGATRGYFNFLFPALGAALLYLPNFDPFLFLLASGGTSYILLTALMLHFYVADRAPRSPGIFEVLLLILSVLIAARYPYWVVESIPVVFTPALTIAVWWMAERGKSDFKWSIAAMCAGLSGSMLSKVGTAAVLVPLSVGGIWKRFWILPYSVRAIAIGVGCIFAVYCILMLLHFLPLFLAAADGIGPESLHNPRWYFVCRDLSALFFVLLSWLIADGPVALALTLGLLMFLLFSWLFQINFVCVALLLGLMMFTRSGSPAPIRSLAVLTFAASLPAAILSDPAGASTGIVWVICLGGAGLAAIFSSIDIEGARLLTFRRSAQIAMTTITIGGFGLVGVARGFIIADSGSHFNKPELTPELRDVWSAVAQLTPPDALIFTDQVDETINVLGGWNSYAFRGQRQIYISSYYTAFELRNDPTKLRQVLSMNDAVLSGTIKPVDVPTKAPHEHAFAVVSKSRVVPLSWQTVYSNMNYTIFKITS